MKKSFPFLPKGRFNLRVKLPLSIITLLVLSFILVTVISVLVSKSALTETLKRSLAAEASLQAEGIRSYLTWTRSMAVDLSTVADGITDEEASKDAIAKMLTPNEQVFGSTISYEPYAFKPDRKYWAPYYSRSKGGTLQFAQLGTSEYDYFQQPWYKIAKDSNAIILSPPYFDAGGGEIWMVTWSVPFYDNTGKLKGVATADIAFSQTQDIVRKIAVGEQGYAFLVDSNGVILGIGGQGGQYKIMEDSALISDPSQQARAWNQMVNDMVKGDAGFVDLTDPQGKTMFVAYEPIGMNTGWSLGLAYPQVELFQPATQLQNTLIFFSVLILIIASVFLLFLSRSITRPLQEITSWAKLFSQEKTHFSASQYVKSVHIKTNDEIQDLADAFNQLSGDLVSTLSTLEQRVADRTKSLANVAEIATIASSIPDLQKMLETVVHLTQRRFGLYHAHIFTYDEDTQVLQIVACGYKEGDEHEGTHGTATIPMEQEQSLVARAARTRQPVIVNDVRSDPGWLPNPLLPDTASELAVPLLVGDKLIGVMDVQSEQANAFTESDADIQMTLGSQVAVSVQNARQVQESRRLQEQYTLAIAGANDGIWDWNVVTNQVFFSPRWKEMVGYREDELNNGFADFEALLHPDDHDRVLAHVNDYLTGKRNEYDVEFRFHHKDGSYRWIRARGKALRDEKGAPYRMAGSHTDITASRTAQETIAKRAAEQEALNRITQSIQGTITIESALQVAARELGHALGMKPTLVTLDPEALPGKRTPRQLMSDQLHDSDNSN
ncbi:MAG: PAS domain-containing protein [Chloroflexi bacterium]|nr:PAS domain-containing protein [Chloroflexota bacterium]